jgi:ribosomal protein S18 acetylase RimI-like enzyme
MFLNRTVLFYFDLVDEMFEQADLPPSIVIERKRDEAEIGATDLEEFINLWNPQIARREMQARFKTDALLWMIKVDGKLAGYGWTLRGHTMEPHFFLLGLDDVHLFDYYVAPAYRGRGLNPLLVNQVLRQLATEGLGRAFIEVAEWNRAQLSSLRKTPFHRLGRARKLTIGRQTMVWFADGLPRSSVEHVTDNSSTAVDRGKPSGVRDLHV